MTEEKQDDEDKRGAREKVSDGIKQGIGVLSAFKEALEETIQEAKEKGDLSTDRARELLKEALEKAQSVAEDAKDRLDFVTQKEFDGLGGVVDVIKQRVAALENHLGFGKGDAEGSDAAESEKDVPDSADTGGDDGTEEKDDAEGTSE
jgi:polyhydroxyalkanoate synthesis regulator phasin